MAVTQESLGLSPLRTLKAGAGHRGAAGAWVGAPRGSLAGVQLGFATDVA